MPRNLPKYIQEFVDRHGRVRRYFRYRGERIPVPYRPGNKSFNALYGELLERYATTADAPPRIGQVYFVRLADKVKIGFTTDLKQRLATMQTSAPGPLEVLHVMPGTVCEESKLHAKFGHLRSAGEWFRLSPEVLACIDGLKSMKAA